MSEQEFGKYTLIRQIATGGMAEIWLAEQRGPGGFNKEMVIKRILPHLAEEGEMTQMFIDEARIVAHLTHPNIGQVYELGEHDGDYFIAMEFIDGLDLVELREKLADEQTALPVAVGARIVCDILEALEYAHNFTDRDGNDVGLIHRDVSPHNVLISNEGIVKLVDFGVAKTALNRTKTETGAVKGKFSYMAPEQIEDQELDQRVDVFATGAVFYELLTGHKPFGEDLQAVSRITSVDATDPREHRDDIPEEMAQIILTALERDRDRRFETAAAMQRAVEGFLKNTGGIVGTRDLANIVRSLRGLSDAKPTEQLFGTEKQGVERSSPRLTKQGVGPDGESRPTGQTPGREEHATRPETPSAARSQQATGDTSSEVSDHVDAGGASTGSSLVLVGLLAGIFVLLAGGIAGGYFLVSHVEATAPEVAEATEESSPDWRHLDNAHIVYIDTDEVASLYRDDEQVGTTPFHTFLEPGDYEVELRRNGANERVEFSVDGGPAIQRFYF